MSLENHNVTVKLILNEIISDSLSIVRKKNDYNNFDFKNLGARPKLKAINRPRNQQAINNLNKINYNAKPAKLSPAEHLERKPVRTIPDIMINNDANRVKLSPAVHHGVKPSRTILDWATVKNREQMKSDNSAKQVKLSPALHQVAEPAKTKLDWVETRNQQRYVSLTKLETKPVMQPNLVKPIQHPPISKPPTNKPTNLNRRLPSNILEKFNNMLGDQTPQPPQSQPKPLFKLKPTLTKPAKPPPIAVKQVNPPPSLNQPPPDNMNTNPSLNKKISTEMLEKFNTMLATKQQNNPPNPAIDRKQPTTTQNEPTNLTTTTAPRLKPKQPKQNLRTETLNNKTSVPRAGKSSKKEQAELKKKLGNRMKNWLNKHPGADGRDAGGQDQHDAAQERDCNL